MAGTNLYWGHGERALRALAEAAGIPVFLNGLARGCLPADHPNFFSRARSAALKGADVALVIGVPMDFRLGFGAAFGEETEIVAIDLAEPERDHPRAVAAELLRRHRRDARRAGGRRRRRHDGLARAPARRGAPRSARPSASSSPTTARRCTRCASTASSAQVLDRDAIVIGDGGDFVSYAGRVVDSYEPGCWLDPGRSAASGSGPGYALAAKLAHPDRQVVLLLGDGAFGFSGMEFDTLARHGVRVVGVMGNNGIWALEKHPMEFLYGYSVAAELRPGDALRPDGRGARRPRRARRAPGELRPALERAFEAGRPALINVLTDPSVAYPRSANLA